MHYWWLQQKVVVLVFRHLFASSLIIIVSSFREKQQQPKVIGTITTLKPLPDLSSVFVLWFRYWGRKEALGAEWRLLKSEHTHSLTNSPAHQLTHTSTTLQLLLYFNEHFWSRQTFFSRHKCSAERLGAFFCFPQTAAFLFTSFCVSAASGASAFFMLFDDFGCYCIKC